MPKNKKATLDTSVLYEKLKLNKGDFDRIVCRASYGKLYLTRYSIIEINLGLIQVWVKFYQMVEKYDSPALAIKDATNLIGRSFGNIGILLALVAEYNDFSATGNTPMFLNQLEAAIANSTLVFENLISDVIGEFKPHPLAAFYNLRREDYDRFLNDCKLYKQADIESFFVKNKIDVDTLKREFEDELTRHNTKLNRKVLGLLTEVLDDPSKAMLPSKNSSYGDIIISIDSPKNHTLISKDKLFKTLSRGLSKDFHLVVALSR